jgi:dTDP-4-dehydrorhamnose 3,5-epimerase
MKVIETAIRGVLLLEPRVFADPRGSFMETFHSQRYAEAGIRGPFIQDNFTRSMKGALRGLHFQEPQAQGKLVQVLAGEVFDVVVDVRRGSPTFRQWVGMILSSATPQQLWVPPGFAHGFCVLSDVAHFHYKCTEAYSPQAEQTIAWNDPDLAIRWPITDPVLSPKDAAAPKLADARILPAYRPV